MDIKTMSDEELIKCADEEAFSQLISRYKPIVTAKAVFIGRGKSEAETADLIEEGMIAVFFAVKTFDSGKGAKFKTYADRCIENRMKSIVSKQNSIRIKETEDEIAAEECADGVSPESIIIERERFDEVMNRAARLLSDMELSVLETYLYFESYKEISKRLGIDEKAVDNAMQRVRRKLRSAL